MEQNKKQPSDRQYANDILDGIQWRSFGEGFEAGHLGTPCWQLCCTFVLILIRESKELFENKT